MFKRILILIIPILLITGCGSTKIHNENGLVLDDICYSSNDFIDIDNEYLNKTPLNNYVLFIYNNYCSLPIPCEKIFKEYMDKYDVSFLSMNIDEYKKTGFYSEVKYAPSVLVISNGNIVAFLDAESDDDLGKYQDVNEFETWINNYIYTK